MAKPKGEKYEFESDKSINVRIKTVYILEWVAKE